MGNHYLREFSTIFGLLAGDFESCFVAYFSDECAHQDACAFDEVISRKTKRNDDYGHAYRGWWQKLNLAHDGGQAAGKCHSSGQSPAAVPSKFILVVHCIQSVCSLHPNLVFQVIHNAASSSVQVFVNLCCSALSYFIAHSVICFTCSGTRTHVFYLIFGKCQMWL